MISRRRRNSFHKSFLSEDFRSTRASRWAAEWRPLLLGLADGRLRAPEVCARIVVDVHRELFGERWTNGLRAQSEAAHQETPALALLARHRVRALPETAAQALLRWASGEIHLETFLRLPDAFEVLKLQARGIRAVGLHLTEEEIRGFHQEGRDFYSFMIHDLIHAQLMTEDPLAYSHQVKFAGWLWRDWAHLTTGLSGEGLRELEYMAADMNSHIVHLLKTFKSWMERHRPELAELNSWLVPFGSVDSEILEGFEKGWSQLNREVALGQPDVHREILELWSRLPNPSVSSP